MKVSQSAIEIVFVKKIEFMDIRMFIYYEFIGKSKSTSNEMLENYVSSSKVISFPEHLSRITYIKLVSINDKPKQIF